MADFSAKQNNVTGVEIKKISYNIKVLIEEFEPKAINSSQSNVY
jgi:hypothetical protein